MRVSMFQPGTARSLTVRGLLCTLALLACQCWPMAALAQAPQGAVDAGALLEEARQDVDAVRETPHEGLSDAQLNELRNRALGGQGKAEKAEASLKPALADVSARLTELGTPSAGVAEAPDVAAQRLALTKEQATLDSQVKRARLLALEAEQAAKSAVTQRRQQFGARLSERTAAPLGPTFWRELSRERPADANRLHQFTHALATGIASVPAAAWLGMGALIAMVVALHLALQRLLVRVASTRIPQGRLRRSLHATGVVALWVLTTGLVAHVLSVGLSTGASASNGAVASLTALDSVFWFAGFTYGLGSALLMAGRPSWRLTGLSDDAATRLGWFPLALALAIALGWTLSRLAVALETSLATTAALNALIALAYVLIATAGLLAMSRRHGADEPRQPACATDAKAPAASLQAATPVWVVVLRTAAWAFLAVTFLALLSGHVAFATFMASQLVWFLVVAGAAYLVATLVDDLCSTLPGNAQAHQADGQAPGTARQQELSYLARTRAQAAVLLSAVARVGIYFLALLLVLAPYGEGPLELLQRASHVNEGLSIGEVSLKPGAVLQAALLLVIGLAGVRLFKRWLSERFMPTTQMDAGMKMSVITLSGYAGTVVIIAMAISAVGMGLERVTWVASALSVGIGFGLQAIVQNFVSGLILLAERPVKVGDWVSLPGVEGDIRRINVRATEIQMGDRSTVIVPNSEFITKIVRNVTYSDNIGLVQIKLPMPLSTDTQAVREVLLSALADHRAVLGTPAPSVQLEGITEGRLVFVVTGFVNSPRAAGGVKSDLLFDIFERLRAAHITLEQPGTVVLRDAGPGVASDPGPA